MKSRDLNTGRLTTVSANMSHYLNVFDIGQLSHFTKNVTATSTIWRQIL